MPDDTQSASGGYCMWGGVLAACVLFVTFHVIRSPVSFQEMLFASTNANLSYRAIGMIDDIFGAVWLFILIITTVGAIFGIIKYAVRKKFHTCSAVILGLNAVTFLLAFIAAAAGA